MRIMNFTSFLRDQSEHTRTVLNGTAVVIDAHNFLYNKYRESNLNYLFGCECDGYANFLREQLNIFRKANVKCYFIFKGGDKDDKKLLGLNPVYENKLLQKQQSAQALLSRELNLQVLNEMGFDYAICEYVNKEECVALAQKLNCPIISLDVEYFFYGTPYILSYSLSFDQSTNILECLSYKLVDMKRRYEIRNKQIAIFITIFDDQVFSKDFVENLLKKINICAFNKIRYGEFLRWLSQNREKALRIISQCVNQDEYRKLKLELDTKFEKFFKPPKSVGLTSKYLLNKDSCKIQICDPDWFAKGVLWNFIPIPFINMYRWRIAEGLWSAEDFTAEDSLLLSTPIFRYAFDLLTNFKDEKLIYKGRRCRDVEEAGKVFTAMDSSLEIQPSVRKPDYGDGNVFENGWDNILDYKLFEHFLEETLKMSDLNKLKRIPPKATLLIISLLYFSHRKQIDAECEVFAVLLSYVVLGALTDETVGEETLNKNERIAAVNLKNEYAPCQLITDYDPRTLHPLVEFQHCLRHINFLNTLCGSPFTPTVYCKTFNATFVYNIVRDMKKCEGSVLLDEKLKTVPTIQSYLNDLVNLYKEMEMSCSLMS